MKIAISLFPVANRLNTVREGNQECLRRVARSLAQPVIVKQVQKERQTAHWTQWAAQFAVASELSKRGYQVGLTMGVHPVIDLMVVSPNGVPFLIDVKAQYKKRP